MNQLNFKGKYGNVHFIGIGGISMSGLAEILLNDGITVSGSDMSESDMTIKLKSDGADVHIGHNAINITDNIDLVIFNAAIKNDNPEYMEAKSKGIELMERSTFLGIITKCFKKTLSIAGTHGKTSATAMMAQVLLSSGCDPTISIGGIMKNIDNNILVGKSEYFVVESCEYCDSFLELFPHSAIILNIEYEHTDFFKDFEQVIDSYTKFAHRIPADGTLVINKAIERLSDIKKGLKCNIETFGNFKSGADWTPQNITFDELACGSFDIAFKGEVLGRINLKLTGEHNILNAVSVFALCHSYNIDIDKIIAGLEGCVGVKRRFEKLGEYNGFYIVDDFAHHPTEVSANIKAAKKCSINNLWCVFQPHTYSRFIGFLDEFAKVLSECDYIIIADIYSAREVNTNGISSAILAEKIKPLNNNVYYIPNFEEIEKFVIQNCKKNDLLLTLGAGDIYKVGKSIICK